MLFNTLKDNAIYSSGLLAPDHQIWAEKKHHGSKCREVTMRTLHDETPLTCNSAGWDWCLN